MAVAYVPVDPTRNLGFIAKTGLFSSILVDDILTLENAPQFREAKVDTVVVTPGVEPPQVPVYTAQLSRMGVYVYTLTAGPDQATIDPNVLDGYQISLDTASVSAPHEVTLLPGAYEGQIVKFDAADGAPDIEITYSILDGTTATHLLGLALDSVTLQWSNNGIRGGWVLVDDHDT